MILNIVKNGTENTRIAEAIREVFPDSEVKVKEYYGMSVDIEISSQEGLHSLEGLKELEDCFKAVSYTHLDVYKRQVGGTVWRVRINQYSLH